MKRNFILFLLLMLSVLFISSCARGFSPMYYYNRTSKSSSSTNNGVLPPDLGGGEENLSPDEDPFHPDYGDWNRPDYGFSLNFDDYVIEASFNNKNQPTYKLVKKNAWYVTDTLRNEYAYNGADTTGGGVTMGNVKYYLYKSKNPNFNAESSYNKSTRIERFYFYRFTATAAGQPTDNYLIAIDTYSKLVFAFGVPTSWRKIAGIPAPNQWGPVELGWEADANNNSQVSFANVEGIQYFYEYDPVGILHEDGTIEIYQWCLDSIGNNNRYAPRFDGEFGDTNRAIATYGKAGRSPYIPVKIKEDNEPKYKMKITVAGVSIKNIDSKTANRYALDGFGWKKGDIQKVYDYADFTYNLKMAAYSDSDVAPIINNVAKDMPDKGLVGGPSIEDKYKINVGDVSEKTVDEPEYIVEYKENDNIYIELYFDIRKYDEPMWGSTMEWPYDYVTDNKISVKLKYNKEQNKFVYDSHSDSYGNRLVDVDKSYSISENEEKEIFITIDGQDGDENWKCRNNPTGLNNKIELRYKLKFEELGIIETK